MTLVQDPPQHPLLRFAAALDEALDGAHASDPVYLSPAERRAVLESLARSRSRLEGLELRLLASAVGDDAGEAGAFRDVADFVATRTCADVGAVRKQERLAVALDERWSTVATALSEGRVNTAQARVLAEGLGALPTSLDPAVLRDAETTLVDLAGKHPPAELRRLARRVLDVVAPEIAEEHEARALEAEEARARDGLSLHVLRNADGVAGRSRAIWTAPDAAIERLVGYVEAWTSPRRQATHPLELPEGAVAPGSPASGERLPIHTQRGIAMLALLEHLDPAKLPVHGGTATTLVVTIDHEVLMGRLGTASLLNGEHVTAGEVRRLACGANLVPAVLGGDSRVLDVGRQERYFSKAQVLALRVRDRRCRAFGCHQSAARCEAHHKKPWEQEGPTDLDNGALLCCFHHHRVHDERYEHEWLPDGDVRFWRRT